MLGPLGGGDFFDSHCTSFNFLGMFAQFLKNIHKVKKTFPPQWGWIWGV